MPIWIPIIIAALVLTAGGTALKLNWNGILIKFKGKKLAILGEREVGKTHLLTFLTSGSIPGSYTQTMRPDKVPSRRFQLRELDLKIKETRDLRGSHDAYADWKTLSLEADVIFYLFRIDKLMEHDAEAEDRVRKDMKQIAGWLAERRPPAPVFLIGTHGDLTNPDLTTIPDNALGDYLDRVRALPVIKECELRARAGGSRKVTVVLGSLNSLENTEALVFNIFSQLQDQS